MSDTETPLWRLMHAAENSIASDYTSADARMILAVADYIRQNGQPRPAPMTPAYHRWRERQMIADDLEDQAKIAEAGE